MFRKFSEIVEEGKKNRAKLVIAASHDSGALLAVMDAYEKGIIEPILIGDIEKTKKIAEENGKNIESFEKIDIGDAGETAAKAVELVREGKAELIMKGMVSSSIFMKEVLDTEKGIKTGRTLSHSMLFESPLHNRIINVTDGGVIPDPDVKMKTDILNNAIYVMNALGVDKPRIALIAASERKTDRILANKHAMELMQLYKEGEGKFPDGVVMDGPFGIDIPISRESAEHKGIDSPVAGDSDIWLMPNMESGNILIKILVYYLNVPIAGVIIGAKVPIVLVSRSDSPEVKLYSIALAKLVQAFHG